MCSASKASRVLDAANRLGVTGLRLPYRESWPVLAKSLMSSASPGRASETARRVSLKQCFIDSFSTALTHQHQERFVTSVRACGGRVSTILSLQKPEPGPPPGRVTFPDPPQTTTGVKMEGHFVPESLKEQTRGSQKEPLNILPPPCVGLSHRAPLPLC